LHKFLITLLASGLFAVPALAQDAVQPALVEDVVSAATQCMLAANLSGADMERLTEAGWSLNSGVGEELVYAHPGTSVSISLSPDDDDVSRICVVKAPLTSSGDIQLLTDQPTQALRARPIEQTNSTIWMVNSDGTRGLQLFNESSSENSRVRLIGAHFTED
jgi:hypothetical protein